MIGVLIQSLTTWAINLASSLGYMGIFIAMIIESSILPLPSEIILIPAGLAASKGNFSITLLLLVSVIGSIIGALFNYTLAYFLGRKTIDKFLLKYKKLFFISKETMAKTDKFFETDGEITTFLGRLIVGIRHLISLPAGFARMNLFKFCFYTGLGALVWSAVLIAVGFIFGSNMDFILKNFRVVSYVLALVIFIILLIYILVRRMRRLKNINNKY